MSAKQLAEKEEIFSNAAELPDAAQRAAINQSLRTYPFPLAEQCHLLKGRVASLLEKIIVEIEFSDREYR